MTQQDAHDANEPDSPAAWAGFVRTECDRLGFALTGVCRADALECPDSILDWVASGRSGTMDWFARTAETRTDPGRVLPGALSVVMVADLYHTRDGEQDVSRDGVGRVARYARGRDYHTVIKKRLHALCDRIIERSAGLGGAGNSVDGRAGVRAFVDTAPVPERELAQRAGLGWIGKNTMLIHPVLGSYTFLGGVLTTLDIEPCEPKRRVPDHCGTCTRCIDACPTDAIDINDHGHGRVDARACLSALTIEHRGEIDPIYHDRFDDWLYGCDICQEVCPHNSPRPAGVDVGERHDAYEPRRTGFDLFEVLGWDEDARRAAFQSSAMKRATLEMMQRNARIILGNTGGGSGDAEQSA